MNLIAWKHFKLVLKGYGLAHATFCNRCRPEETFQFIVLLYLLFSTDEELAKEAKLQRKQAAQAQAAASSTTNADGEEENKAETSEAASDTDRDNVRFLLMVG